jgi:hypothetical protein
VGALEVKVIVWFGAAEAADAPTLSVDSSTRTTTAARNVGIARQP